MTDVLHEPRDLKGRWTHLSSEAPEGSSPRAVAAFGKGFSALFPADSGPTAISPWQHAGRRIDEPLYDKALVAKALVNPHYQPVDPRNLHSIQDSITKAGLRHYLSDPNKPFDPNNSDPAIVYVRARNRQKVILAGHHRAAAALVKGQPFHAIVVREPGTEDVMLANIDLTRHVRTPAGVERYHLPVGTPLGSKAGDSAAKRESAIQKILDMLTPGLQSNTTATEKARYQRVDAAAKRAEQYAKDHPDTSTSPGVKRGNPETVPLNGRQVPLDKAVKMVSDAYGWDQRDKVAGVGPLGEKSSVLQQDKAQIVARSWYEQTLADEDSTKAQGLWQEYQSPEQYSHIQYILRTGQHDSEYPETDPAEMKKIAALMFDKGGYTTEKPMTVFRALKSKRASSFEPGDDTSGVDWAEKLKPGEEFTDKGIVSTTAHMRFSQGWLMNDAQGRENREPQKNDVVVEIRLPKGQRIVGGDPQFIETMLPPGTRMKVVSSTVNRARAVDPLTRSESSFDYTHVIAEVIQ